MQLDDKTPIEKAFIIFGLVFLIGAIQPLLPLISGGGKEWEQFHTEGSRIYQIVSGSFYLVTFVLIMTRLEQTFFLVSRNKLLFLFLLFIIASAAWSANPGISLRRSIALTGTTLFGTYLALRLRPDELLRYVYYAFAITLTASLLVILLIPSMGVHQNIHSGAWAGVLSHKNDFGRLMVLGVLVCMTYYFMDRERNRTVGILLLLFFLCVVMSQSRTSWVALTILLLSIPLLLISRRPGLPLAVQVLILAGVGLGGVGFVLVEYSEELLEIIGRDATLTGRTHIWELAWEAAAQKPWLGYGYKTFWGYGGLARYIAVGHAHNNFLDVLVELGGVGFGIFLTLLFIYIKTALQRMKSQPDFLGLFYALFFFYLMVFSLATRVMPLHGTITWALFVAITIHFSLWSSERSKSQTPMGQKVNLQGST
jgi:O-antigen ligase